MTRDVTDLDAQLDRLAQERIEVLSLPRLRALVRGLNESETERALLLCIDADGAARDRVATILARRELPSICFAEAGDLPPNGVGSWSALRGLAEMGVSVEMRGRVEWELGKAPAEHTFASMLRARGELERRLGRSLTVYRCAGERPRPEFFEFLDRLGYEFSAGRSGCGATLRLESWREVLNGFARVGAAATAQSSMRSRR